MRGTRTTRRDEQTNTKGAAGGSDLPRVVRVLGLGLLLLGAGCVAEVEEPAPQPADEYAALAPVCVLDESTTAGQFSCADSDGWDMLVSFENGEGGWRTCLPEHPVPSCVTGDPCQVTTYSGEGELHGVSHQAQGTCKMVCLGPGWCRAE